MTARQSSRFPTRSRLHAFALEAWYGLGVSVGFHGISVRYPMIRRVLDERLSYLGATALVELAKEVTRVEQEGLEGAIVEAGCALGGSTLVLAAAKRPERPMFVFDVFDIIPPPSVSDGPDAHERYTEIVSGKAVGIKGNPYYGYEGNLLERVREAFLRHDLPVEENRIALVKGRFEESLHLDQPIALAHIDCDWYDSVMTCLSRMEPLLVRRGVLVVDDYVDWSGCQSAVHDYFRGREREFDFLMRARLQIRRR